MEEQKRKRLTSEKSLQHNTFKLKLGTTDKTNPLIVYLEGGVFITPNEEKDSYINDVKAIKYGLKKTIEALGHDVSFIDYNFDSPKRFGHSINFFYYVREQT